MLIISINKTELGQHLIEEQPWRNEIWIDEYIEVPEILKEIAISSKGYCNLIIENSILTDIEILEQPKSDPTQPPEGLAERVAELELALQILTGDKDDELDTIISDNP